jgi:5-methylcytosine-specific restriction enzyme subunit McrC
MRLRGGFMRFDRRHDFPLRICELIHKNMLVSEKAGTSKFIDFVRDERQMAVLFEDFVRNVAGLSRKVVHR